MPEKRPKDSIFRRLRLWTARATVLAVFVMFGFSVALYVTGKCSGMDMDLRRYRRDTSMLTSASITWNRAIAVIWVLRASVSPENQTAGTTLNFTGTRQVGIEQEFSSPEFGVPIVALGSKLRLHSNWNRLEPMLQGQLLLILPTWLPLVITGVLPALWIALRMRSWRRRNAILCQICGYDLRASPHRCPECGTPKAKADSVAVRSVERARRRWLTWTVAACALIAFAKGGSWLFLQVRDRVDEGQFKDQAYKKEDTETIVFVGPPTRSAVRYLARLPGRWYIDFHCNLDNVSAAYDAFHGILLPNIRGLIFDHPDGGSVLIKTLAKLDRELDSIERLELQGTELTDDDLRTLLSSSKSLQKISGLNLSDTKITDAGIAELARPSAPLGTLKFLDLGGTAITDVSLRSFSREDCCLRALLRLYVGGTHTTRDGVENLTKARPSLKIYHYRFMEG